MMDVNVEVITLEVPEPAYMTVVQMLIPPSIIPMMVAIVMLALQTKLELAHLIVRMLKKR